MKKLNQGDPTRACEESQPCSKVLPCHLYAQYPSRRRSFKRRDCVTLSLSTTLGIERCKVSSFPSTHRSNRRPSVVSHAHMRPLSPRGAIASMCRWRVMRATFSLHNVSRLRSTSSVA